MSLADDARAMCRERSLTVPVQYGTQRGRGFFRVEDLQIAGEGGLDHAGKSRTLLVADGDFTFTIATVSTITLGSAGAASASGGRSYAIQRVDDEREDGFVALTLARA